MAMEEFRKKSSRRVYSIAYFPEQHGERLIRIAADILNKKALAPTSAVGRPELLSNQMPFTIFVMSSTCCTTRIFDVNGGQCEAGPRSTLRRSIVLDLRSSLYSQNPLPVPVRLHISGRHGINAQFSRVPVVVRHTQVIPVQLRHKHRSLGPETGRNLLHELVVLALLEHVQ